MTQRAKEVLATLTDRELVALMCLVGAKEAATGGQMAAEMVALRGGLATAEMSPEALKEMREDISGSYAALTTATQALLTKLDGLLGEVVSPE